MVPEAGSARARAKIGYGLGEMTAHGSWGYGAKGALRVLKWFLDACSGLA
jgi:hypothetical protein